MSNYKITAEENIPFEIREGYEIVTEDNEGLLRKKLSPGKEFVSGNYVAVIEKGVVSKIAIFRTYKDWSYEDFNAYAYITAQNTLIIPAKETQYISCGEDIRLATEEERQKLNSILTINRWKWDAENKRLVKMTEYPEPGELYYYINFDVITASLRQGINDEEEIDRVNIDAGNYFFDISAVREVVQKVNGVINDAKAKRPK
jgi:hypothetical protein